MPRAALSCHLLNVCSQGEARKDNSKASALISKNSTDKKTHYLGQCQWLLQDSRGPCFIPEDPGHLILSCPKDKHSKSGCNQGTSLLSGCGTAGQGRGHLPLALFLKNPRGCELQGFKAGAHGAYRDGAAWLVVLPETFTRIFLTQHQILPDNEGKKDVPQQVL